ncbi:hypothetical protein ABZ780_21455 [Micromonospora sp. NPDC047467]|uniref:hypothetical protein n=1 Tax=Micromonospora sp. NPDC047467 TaxID=3154814 RepID=UPI0033DD0488
MTDRQERALGRLLAIRDALSRGTVSPEWVVISVCTTLETYCSEMLEELIKNHLASADKFEAELITAQKSDLNKSWHSRLKWLSVGFSMQLDDSSHQDLLALIELRNAIAHNGHSFTSRQTARYEEFLRHRKVLESNFGVLFHGAAFKVGPTSGDMAIRLGRKIALDFLR